MSVDSYAALKWSLRRKQLCTGCVVVHCLLHLSTGNTGLCTGCVVIVH